MAKSEKDKDEIAKLATQLIEGIREIYSTENKEDSKQTKDTSKQSKFPAK